MRAISRYIDSEEEIGTNVYIQCRLVIMYFKKVNLTHEVMHTLKRKCRHFDDVLVTESNNSFSMFANLLMANDLSLGWCDINIWFAEILPIHDKILRL